MRWNLDFLISIFFIFLSTCFELISNLKKVLCNKYFCILKKLECLSLKCITNRSIPNIVLLLRAPIFIANIRPGCNCMPVFNTNLLRQIINYDHKIFIYSERWFFFTILKVKDVFSFNKCKSIILFFNFSQKILVVIRTTFYELLTTF